MAKDGSSSPPYSPLVELRRVSKQFFGTRALDEVSLTVSRRTIHGLVGENGAGKSTLGRIVAGVIPPDSGTLLLDGEEVAFGSPRDALARRITTVQQELALAATRSVLDNVYLGHTANRVGFVDKRAMRERFEQLREQLDLEIDPEAMVGTLPVATQQKVEVARAVARDAQLLIIDEPTSALTRDESDRLMKTLRTLRDQGRTIVYISHFLDEVLGLADTVTVLRNGEHVKTSPAEQETEESLITAMLGSPLAVAFPPKPTIDAAKAPAIEVRGLGREGVIDDVSFSIRPGEILGLAGLVGSGRTEVARAVFGADARDSGEIIIAGQPADIRSPRDAIRAGIAMVPESRKDQGLLLDLSVLINLTLPHLDEVSRGPWVGWKEEEKRAGRLLERLGVRPAQPGILARYLSGGNQQKVLFGKWLFREPRILIADEPTRGVDVGSKRAIYDLIAGLAERGMALLLISSELEEVVALAHRVAVMRKGAMVAQLDEGEVTVDSVTRLAFGAEIPGTGRG